MSTIDEILANNPGLYVVGALPKKKTDELMKETFPDAVGALWMAANGDGSIVVFGKTIDELIVNLEATGIK